MRQPPFPALCLLLACVLAPAVGAQPTGSPGRADVPVTDGSDAARDAAVSQAVTRVVLRLTGDPTVLASDSVAELRREADDYLQGYAYREEGPSDDAPAGLRLIARFDVQRLRETLVEAEIPIWPDRPPSVLVWLGRDSEGEREILGSGDADGLTTDLVDAAAALGVNLLFPIMDLQDLSAISYGDLAGGFADPVAEASQRYGADRILAGRLAAAGDAGVDGRWMYIAPDGAVDRWGESADEALGLLGRALDGLVARLRDDYAYLPDLEARGRLEIEVGGIDSLALHERVVERLIALSGVERVNPVRIDAERVVFELAISTPADRVLEALERDGRLVGDEAEYTWE